MNVLAVVVLDVVKGVVDEVLGEVEIVVYVVEGVVDEVLGEVEIVVDIAEGVVDEVLGEVALVVLVKTVVVIEGGQFPYFILLQINPICWGPSVE